MTRRISPHLLRHQLAPLLQPAGDIEPALLATLIHHQPNLNQGDDTMTDLSTATTPDMPDAIDRKRPFKLCAAMHQPRMLEDGQPERSTFRTAVANRLYISREAGRDLFGALDFTGKAGDQLPVERRGPKGCDAAELQGLELWRRADTAAAVDRPELAAAFHAIGWLPEALDEAGWRNLIHRFIDDQLVRNGMVTEFAIHRLRSPDGSWAKMPHVHMIITSRGWRPQGNPGRRNVAWFGDQRSVQAAANAWADLVRQMTP